MSNWFDGKVVHVDCTKKSAESCSKEYLPYWTKVKLTKVKKDALTEYHKCWHCGPDFLAFLYKVAK